LCLLFLACKSPFINYYNKNTLSFPVGQVNYSSLPRIIIYMDHCYFHSQKKRPVSLKNVLPELYEIFTREVISYDSGAE